jgi:hypothetical protein
MQAVDQRKDEIKIEGEINLKNIFQINSDSKIYVICPANNKTGGTELLHQLVFQLNEIGRNAYIAYYTEGVYDKNNPTPTEFKKYVKHTCTVSEIEDFKENVIVFPEVCIGKQRKFKNAQKCVWWLSVDNYNAMLGRLNRLKKYGVLSFLKHMWLNDYSSHKDIEKVDVHLYQSYFAADFLSRKSVKTENMYYLSDYINDIYMNGFKKTNRENIVIYNPKKGIEFSQKLIQAAPDIQWVPIQNMTNQQVRELMQKAKVYIDFGNHPGKDRIPREAAMSGCCVITNRRGSAAYEQDVPIKSCYKFDDIDDNINSIITKTREALDNYEILINEFEGYKVFISNEKEKFEEDVKNIFQ